MRTQKVLDQIFQLDRHFPDAVALESQCLKRFLSLEHASFDQAMGLLDKEIANKLLEPMRARLAFRLRTRWLLDAANHEQKSAVLRRRFYRDLVEMEEPRDAIGGMLGKLFMKNYFETLLNKRNALIKLYAETEKWRAVMG